MKDKPTDKMQGTTKSPKPTTLLAALTLSWGADTTRDEDDWLLTVPSLNQCVPTALVVQDFYGGMICRAPIPCGDSHYWNASTDHGNLDFTGGQFVYLREFPEFSNGQRRSREVLLRNPDVERRYLILSARVGVWLQWLCKKEGANDH